MFMNEIFTTLYADLAKVPRQDNRFIQKSRIRLFTTLSIALLGLV